MLGISYNRRGDTIIEVLLGITVFSMVSIGAMTIMNQGTSAAQRALEITLVRQQIDAQAEALRAAQQAYASSQDPDQSVWAQIKSLPDTATWDSRSSCPTDVADINGAFAMDGRSATVMGDATWFQSVRSAGAPPHAKVVYPDGGVPPVSYGIWIERTLAPNNSAGLPDAYDFMVRACWDGAGMGSTPMQLETLVRLYDPS